MKEFFNDPEHNRIMSMVLTELSKVQKQGYEAKKFAEEVKTKDMADFRVAVMTDIGKGLKPAQEDASAARKLSAEQLGEITLLKSENRDMKDQMTQLEKELASIKRLITSGIDGADPTSVEKKRRFGK